MACDSVVTTVKAQGCMECIWLKSFGVKLTVRSAWPPTLPMYSPVGAVTPADALSITISTAVKRRRDMRICPDAAHLFIDVLAKICYIEDATSIVEARISQVFSQTLEHGERYLPFVHIHNKRHCGRNSDDCRLAYLCTLNCAILNNFRLFNFRFLTRTITSEPKVGLANFNQKWRSARSGRRSVLESVLTPPTLLEMAIFHQLGSECDVCDVEK